MGARHRLGQPVATAAASRDPVARGSTTPFALACLVIACLGAASCGAGRVGPRADATERASAGGPWGTATMSLPLQSRLEVVDAVVLPSGSRFPTTGAKPLGGLSSITPSPRAGEYIVVSDETTSPRVMRFRIGVEHGRLLVMPLGFETITLPPGDPSEGAATDVEGVACLTDGTCYFSSEGNQEREPRLAPSLFGYRGGQLVDRLLLPDKFRPSVTGPATQGVRHNEAFEGLAVTPDGRRLIAGMESTLVQDGERPTATAGALVRVLTFDRTGDEFVAGAEYVYPLGRVEIPASYQQPTGSLGLVDILPLDDGAFLTLERAFVREGAGAKRSLNHIVIYRTSFAGATDVRGLFSLLGSTRVQPMTKSIVLSLADLASGLPPALERLDNFEGLTVGPRLPDGSPTLLLMSDDNFSTSQVTAFVLLRVVRQ